MSRVNLVLIGVLFAAESALLAVVGWHFGWGPLLAKCVVMRAIGVGTIGYVVWRYSEIIAARLDDDFGQDNRAAGDRLLLLAGVMMLVPGLITDLVGLLLLVPAARRGVLRLLSNKQEPDAEGPVTLKFPERWRECERLAA